MPGSIPAFDISSPAAAVGPRAPRFGLFRILRTGGGLAGIVLLCGLLAVALLAARIAPSDPFASVGPPLSAPTLGHPMGTDDLGRDLLSGVAHGTRTSLGLALAVSILTGLIGVIVGALAGWEGGRLDGALMRLTEFVQVVPRFFLAVIVIALFGAGLDRLAFVLALTSWPWIARVVRAEVLSLKQREFVEAARSLGAGRARVLLREVLPNALPPVVVAVSLSAASVILIEAGLSFLGLGDPDVVSLGYLANNAQRFLRVAWWMAVFPGAAIALAVLGLNLLGDGLNEVLNPRRGRPEGRGTMRRWSEAGRRVGE
jgi:peptide/nickel transport system permease protein